MVTRYSAGSTPARRYPDSRGGTPMVERNADQSALDFCCRLTNKASQFNRLLEKTTRFMLVQFKPSALHRSNNRGRSSIAERSGLKLKLQ